MERINRLELGSSGAEEGMESVDLLCSRNAPPQKALVDARSGRHTASPSEE